MNILGHIIIIINYRFPIFIDKYAED